MDATGHPSSGESTYVDRDIWVTRFLKTSEQYLSTGPIFTAVIIYGLIPTVLVAVFIINTIQYFDQLLLFSQLLFLFVIIVVPVLIRYFDETVFPTFTREAEEIVANKTEFIQIINQYEKFFQEKYWMTAGPWTLLLILAVFFSIDFFKRLGISGPLDPVLGIYLLFIIWFGIFSGILIHAGITTVLCIHDVGDLELKIDPLHPDGLGGLSNIGYFAIRSTVIISIGSFCLPLAFIIARRGGNESVISVVVAIFILSLILLFVYPTVYVNRQAQDIRQTELEKRRKAIQKLQNELQRETDSISGDQTEIEKELAVQSLREEFSSYRNVNLYPLTVSILLRLATSIFLPVFFLLLEAYVPT